MAVESLYWICTEFSFSTRANTEKTGSRANGFASLRTTRYDNFTLGYPVENRWFLSVGSRVHKPGVAGSSPAAASGSIMLPRAGKTLTGSERSRAAFVGLFSVNTENPSGGCTMVSTPHRTLRVPSLREYKPSGRAVATIGGRDFYLGT